MKEEEEREKKMQHIMPGEHILPVLIWLNLCTPVAPSGHDSNALGEGLKRKLQRTISSSILYPLPTLLGSKRTAEQKRSQKFCVKSLKTSVERAEEHGDWKSHMNME
ncbi:hypothetical protein HPG69_014350 [Diceros bicornis minor]|uniref:Uncharacterized protein n=1 Tax=Diceros bicornis minor TaxID=77932 RepID=A0A7J7EWL2_DICBM|nr:hypothetical protein HPG69_014350 [Diceros bicornis minor]